MKYNNKILVIDDDEGIRESYKSVLGASHTFDVTAKGAVVTMEFPV